MPDDNSYLLSQFEMLVLENQYVIFLALSTMAPNSELAGLLSQRAEIVNEFLRRPQEEPLR